MVQHNLLVYSAIGVVLAIVALVLLFIGPADTAAATGGCGVGPP